MRSVNTLRPRQNGCHFTDDSLKCIFLNENYQVLIQIMLKFVPEYPMNNIPALVQIMVWRRLGDKPLSEQMMVRLLMHICVTRPQWVKEFWGMPVKMITDLTNLIWNKSHKHHKNMLSSMIFFRGWCKVQLFDFIENFVSNFHQHILLTEISRIWIDMRA